MKEVISSRQGICMIIAFMVDAFVFGTAKEAGTDIWIAILLGLIAAVLLGLIYCRILLKSPGKQLYDIITSVFGKGLGLVICSLYIVYSLYIGSLVLITFVLFTSTVGLYNTPHIVVASIVIGLVIIGVKHGIEVLGRWTEYFTRIIVPIVLITLLFMLPSIEVNNLQPVFGNGLRPIINGAFGVVTFPFAEIAIFMLMISTATVPKTKDVYKIFLIGLLYGGLIICAAHVIAFLTLGQFFYNSSYFPVYTAVSRINIHDILQRVEVVVAVAFIMGGFVKVALYVLAGCKGIASVMRLKDYRFVVTPIGVLVLITALTTFRSTMDIVEHVYYYNYLAVLMLIIIPFIILIGIEIKSKITKWQSKQIHQK